MNTPSDANALPSGSMKKANAMVWWSVKIPAERKIASHVPPTTSSSFDVINHRKTYSSRTEFMKIQNRIPTANFHGTVRPNGSRISTKSSGNPSGGAGSWLVVPEVLRVDRKTSENGCWGPPRRFQKFLNGAFFQNFKFLNCQKIGMFLGLWCF